MSNRLTRGLGALAALVALPVLSLADLPSSFDLRDVDGVNYVTPVKSQTGSTCWCFGTMGAFEGNVMRTGVWYAEGETGWPDFAEYHLDWWNGFNQFNNDDLDPNTGDGLAVHNGGDYRVATAYMTRGDGSVRETDAPSFGTPSARHGPGFHVYYPRDVVWLNAGADLSNIDTIKETIMTHGALAMCMAYAGPLMVDFCHYQPPEDEHAINHSITIVGWDDDKVTQAPLPGAWLVKNSWGKSWGLDGFFWVSYYDKAAGQHPLMGCVSFQNIVLNRYDRIYYHDYHGWRNEKTDVSEAFNAFVAQRRQRLDAISFYTMGEDVSYTYGVFGRFEGGELLDELAGGSGTIAHKGYHTIDLDTPVYLTQGDEFYIYVQLSHGGHAYDCTGIVDEMMGATTRAVVQSTASPGESFYRDVDTGDWVDLTDFDETANFCIKGLAFDVGMEVAPAERFTAEGPAGGPFTPPATVYEITNTDAEPFTYEVSSAPCTGWVTLAGRTSGELMPGQTAEVTVEITSVANRLPSGLHRGRIYFTNVTSHGGDTDCLVDLVVDSPPVQYEWTFDSNPQWSTNGDWAWGQPHGAGGQCGAPDPTSGHTGDYVCGYNLWGDYANNMTNAKRLLTDAIDCSGLSHVRLGFWRWLGVGPPEQDKAQIWVKVNDGTFELAWENPTEIADSAWVYQECDLSRMADGQPEVFVRWNMGPTDEQNTYCGWNIDDVRILGFDQLAPLTGDLDDNCAVDRDDLETLLLNYGATGALPEEGDTDGDADVDLSDLATLLAYYGCTCP